ncbi:glycosyltransferase family 4 protein [Psychrobacter faecalis]
MKILHICLAAHYTEGMAYQDNQLPDQNFKDGHDVLVVSDCYKYENGELVKVPEEDKVLDSGVRLIRLEYDFIINKTISAKVRKVTKLKELLEQEKPDVILFHGVAGWELLTVANYKKNNPKTKLYLDSHQDLYNSGTFFISLFFQYRIFNRYIVSRIRKHVDKVLYISLDSRDFLMKIYGFSEEELEFYPLGGNIVDEDMKKCLSKSVRKSNGYTCDDIIIVHSGKLSKSKKTNELIEAFSSVSSERLKLIIIGSIPKEETAILDPLISADKRISFLGWKTSSELVKYLCAADLYFQPGTQSATMQNAICCGTPIALYPYKSHEPYLKNNGFYVSCKSDYVEVFEKVLSNPNILKKMSLESYSIARKLLDYKLLASRLYY